MAYNITDNVIVSASDDGKIKIIDTKLNVIIAQLMIEHEKNDSFILEHMAINQDRNLLAVGFQNRIYFYYLDIQFMRKYYFVFPFYFEKIEYSSKKQKRQDLKNIYFYWWKNNLIWQSETQLLLFKVKIKQQNDKNTQYTRGEYLYQLYKQGQKSKNQLPYNKIEQQQNKKLTVQKFSLFKFCYDYLSLKSECCIGWSNIYEKMLVFVFKVQIKWFIGIINLEDILQEIRLGKLIEQQYFEYTTQRKLIQCDLGGNIGTYKYISLNLKNINLNIEQDIKPTMIQVNSKYIVIGMTNSDSLLVINTKKCLSEWEDYKKALIKSDKDKSLEKQSFQISFIYSIFTPELINLNQTLVTTEISNSKKFQISVDNFIINDDLLLLQVRYFNERCYKGYLMSINLAKLQIQNIMILQGFNMFGIEITFYKEKIIVVDNFNQQLYGTFDDFEQQDQICYICDKNLQIQQSFRIPSVNVTSNDQHCTISTYSDQILLTNSSGDIIIFTERYTDKCQYQELFTFLEFKDFYNEYQRQKDINQDKQYDIQVNMIDQNIIQDQYQYIFDLLKFGNTIQYIDEKNNKKKVAGTKNINFKKILSLKIYPPINEVTLYTFYQQYCKIMQLEFLSLNNVYFNLLTNIYQEDQLAFRPLNQLYQQCIQGYFYTNLDPIKQKTYQLNKNINQLQDSGFFIVVDNKQMYSQTQVGSLYPFDIYLQNFTPIQFCNENLIKSFYGYQKIQQEWSYSKEFSDDISDNEDEEKYQINLNIEQKQWMQQIEKIIGCNGIMYNQNYIVLQQFYSEDYYLVFQRQQLIQYLQGQQAKMYLILKNNIQIKQQNEVLNDSFRQKFEQFKEQIKIYQFDQQYIKQSINMILQEFQQLNIKEQTINFQFLVQILIQIKTNNNQLQIDEKQIQILQQIIKTINY